MIAERDEWDDYGKPCPVCGGEMDWTDCDACDGDGSRDVFEDDPLWYQPGDTEPCQTCNGEGGWWVCHNRFMHAEAEARSSSNAQPPTLEEKRTP